MKFTQVLGATAAALAVAHASPSLATVGPLRRNLMPGLAGVGSRDHVALTFDGGPHPEATPTLLRLLDRAGVKATFFVLGRAAQEQPDLTRALLAAGHEIGVHGYDHRLLLRCAPRAARDDLGRALWTIAAVTGRTPQWWRPPYGAASISAMRAARRRGLRPVLWTCYGRDEQPGRSADGIYREVMRELDGGATLMLHAGDGNAATLEALPAILTTCRARGLRVGPLRDHGLLPLPVALEPAISR